MSAFDIEELTRFAHRLADASGRAILPYFRSPLVVENKAVRGFDPVTAADQAAERAIRALIADQFPTHGVVGEEFPETPAQGPFSWVIDPIDGTRAFIAGLPLWGTLIALTYEGLPVIGVLDQPYLGERFTGVPGGAAVETRQGRSALRVRPGATLRDAVLSTTDPTAFTPAELGAFEQVRAAAKLTRYGCDCYAYGMLAAGGVDLVVESGLKPHDILALIPIVEGAGGVVSDWRGAPAFAGGQVVAAANRTLQEEAMVALKRSAGP
jgi:myo-inositol-1(or 4)-monophosphatase